MSDKRSDAGLEHILHRFESLGDNCEFGFLQRRFKVEPSSFFRWASVPTTSLIKILQNEFKEAFVYSNLSPSAQDMVIDAIYRISYHTKIRSVFDNDSWHFVTPEVERRAIYELESKKFLYLRDKFIESMHDGDNIYVIKANGGLDDDMMLKVYELISSVANNKLLTVRQTDDPKLVGTVSALQPGLLLGFIDRFAPYSQADDVSVQAWSDICRNANDAE